MIKCASDLMVSLTAELLGLEMTSTRRERLGPENRGRSWGSKITIYSNIQWGLK